MKEKRLWAVYRRRNMGVPWAFVFAMPASVSEREAEEMIRLHEQVAQSDPQKGGYRFWYLLIRQEERDITLCIREVQDRYIA